MPRGKYVRKQKQVNLPLPTTTEHVPQRCYSVREIVELSVDKWPFTYEVIFTDENGDSVKIGRARRAR